MSEEIFRNKIIINSPESISIGYNSWFGLDTKLVGRIKALLKENEDLQQKVEQLESSITNEEYVRQVNLNIELSEKIKKLEKENKELKEKLNERCKNTR